MSHFRPRRLPTGLASDEDELGDKGWNLVPGRRWLNSQMFKDAESDAIAKISADKPEILRYETTVTKYTDDANEPQIGSFFPLEMEVSYGTADKTGKFIGEKITKQFSQPAPRQKAEDEKMNLNTMSKSRLAAAIKLTNKGLTSEAADDIATKLDGIRKSSGFKNFSDFETRGEKAIGEKFPDIALNLADSGYKIPDINKKQI